METARSLDSCQIPTPTASLFVPFVTFVVQDFRGSNRSDMKPKDLLKLGYQPGPAIGVAIKLIPAAQRELGSARVKEDLAALLNNPAEFLDHSHFADLAQALIDHAAQQKTFTERAEPAPYRVWGQGLEAGSLDQMKNAVRLPVAVQGALMPDAHQGYGLPIGGVLATDNCVIPFGVGVDIACRMKLSILDIPARDITRLHRELCHALEHQTVFGTGGEHRKPLDHQVLEDDWSFAGIVQHVADKARRQLGTSGSGNHFVEFGILTVGEGSGFGVQGSGGEKKLEVSSGKREEANGFKVQGSEGESSNLEFAAPGSSSLNPEPRTLNPSFDLAAGQYLALLSHSGSRGAGAAIADHYSRLATHLHPELPPELRRLAWLDLDTDPGREYWMAMNLMGRYAHANHEMIHKLVAKALKAKMIAGVENHHNFAWKEMHGGREVIVHRKGATPAGAGVLGVIPGSMATPGYVVRGRGSAPSLFSASHGAGRQMSRTAAKEKFRWSGVRPILANAGVTLLSAGIDEVPGSYKDIHAVMSAQADLVEVIAQFDPKIVKMAPEGERAED